MALGGRLDAHSGHGSDVQVRVFDDAMRVVIRTSIPLAWARLGSQAPAMADDAGRAAAVPLLVAAASEMISVTAGGKPVLPLETKSVFEIDDHVAFVLVFARPSEWPVELNARFVNTLDDLDTGTITVYDHSGARFARDLEPLARKSVDASDPRLAFSLTPRERAMAPTAELTPPASAVPDPPTHSNFGFRAGVALLIVLTGAIVCVFWRVLTHRKKSRNPFV